ncbi:unnamed protein product [Nezara viridula]|uniref:Neuropeptide n=1 Tax=Nezara viridula TaxID=85310 RepID=A0A9P0HIK7_NEZVI|nr:unnamed protein product [Nezara viridula]
MKTVLVCLFLTGIAVAQHGHGWAGWAGNGLVAPAGAAHGLVAPEIAVPSIVAPAVAAPRFAAPSHAGPAAGGPASPGYVNRLLANAIARHNTPWGAIGHGHSLRYGPHYYQ